MHYWLRHHTMQWFLLSTHSLHLTKLVIQCNVFNSIWYSFSSNFPSSSGIACSCDFFNVCSLFFFFFFLFLVLAWVLEFQSSYCPDQVRSCHFGLIDAFKFCKDSQTCNNWVLWESVHQSFQCWSSLDPKITFKSVFGTIVYIGCFSRSHSFFMRSFFLHIKFVNSQMFSSL